MAQAVVPGSHKHVPEILAMRDGKWAFDVPNPGPNATPEQRRAHFMSRRWTGEGEPGDFHEPFTSIGLTPSVTNVKAGDMVIFDTALCVYFPPPATGKL